MPSIGQKNVAYRVFMEKREGKRPLARPRRRWEDNIKMELQEIEFEDVVMWFKIGTIGGML